MTLSNKQENHINTREHKPNNKIKIKLNKNHWFKINNKGTDPTTLPNRRQNL